jgi:uncharacterized YkwD family protein
MKHKSWISLILIAALFSLSACDAVDLGRSLEPAAQPAQPAVSVSQRQSSILTPIGQQPENGGSAGEDQNTGTEPTMTALTTQKTSEGSHGENLKITATPTMTLSGSPSGEGPTHAKTGTPTPTNTQGAAAPPNPPLPTNTPVPPTATFTFTPVPESEPTFTHTPTATIEEPGGGDPPSCDPAGNSSFEAEVISLINQERANEGLPALSNQSQLTSAARTHSDDMACNNFFSHTSPTTGSPFDRITAAGYSYSAAGENIAAGYGSPSALVDGWMNSSGHRANILSTNFTQIGVGYAYWSDSDYGAYWTAVFASP